MTKLEDLKGEVDEVADDLEEAASHGDPRENADYDAAKEKRMQAQIRLYEVTSVVRTWLMSLT